MNHGNDIRRSSGPAFPADLRAASRVFGTAATVLIIGHLQKNGPQTRDEIVDHTGVSAGIVGQSLNRLASLDAVCFDANQSSLPARDRKYDLNEARLRTLLNVLNNYVSGSETPDPA